MHSLYVNDNFKIYVAETKKVGSKYIQVVHGGGLTIKFDPYNDFFEKVSDKIISWDRTEQKGNIFVNLSPTLPSIKLRKHNKIGSYCSIVFVEGRQYVFKFATAETPNQSIDFFNELTNFVSNLNPEIKSKIKFRSKGKFSYNSEKRFSEMFGKKSIDKISFNNPFKNTILNSKLIIMTYPETAFTEAMYSNTPTILIVKKNHYQFTEEALNTFNILKENKIAFEDFNEAKIHINKYWKEIDTWWQWENVQSARKLFLKNFFNLKSNWYKEWSDYIYFHYLPNNVK